MTRQMPYQCATFSFELSIFLTFLLLVQEAVTILNYFRIMRQVFYHFSFQLLIICLPFLLLIQVALTGLKHLTLGWWSVLPLFVSTPNYLFSPFLLLVQVAATGLKCLTSGWWGKCSTLVLQIHFIIWTIISPSASGNGWARKPDVRMMRQAFYQCATVSFQQTMIFLHLFAPGANSRGWTQTLDFWMMGQVFYHFCFNYLLFISPF